MKEKLAILLLLITTLACRKTSKQEIEPKEKLYPITFNTSSFTQESKTISGKVSDTTAAVNYLRALYYFIYDDKGELVKSRTQSIDTSSHFGIVQDSLPMGQYNIVFLGSDQNSPYGDPIDDQSYYEIASLRESDRNPNYFLKNIPITVTRDGVNENVTLERIVGMLSVMLTDNIIPESVSYYEIKMPSARRYYFRNGVRALEEYNYKSYPAVVGGKFLGAIRLFEPGKPIDITITAFNNKNEIIVSKVINNVSILKNREVVLKGKLFSNSTGFSIFVNSNWDATPTTIEF
ncbi:FimB/Mfa2 family fimbrial subunit [Desertivirga arenae]|uniref:FimB/Mfa2 family fimbrial subunit n=1 Tax=Desertivirga arenae TaxID=2810309 RepID=UPI001A95EB02|nr:FimB/Mfa2 family fimbrial subunit [Pedobacter sp. SYSU D00823]